MPSWTEIVKIKIETPGSKTKQEMLQNIATFLHSSFRDITCIIDHREDMIIAELVKNEED